MQVTIRYLAVFLAIPFTFGHETDCPVPSRTEPSEITLSSGKERNLDEDPLRSPNNKVILKFETGLSLAVVKRCDNAVLWRQHVSQTSHRVVMQRDGNFAVYGTFGNTVSWSSQTFGNSGAVLRLEDDGHLCVHNGLTCIWSNGQRFNTSCGTSIFAPTDTHPDTYDIILHPGQTKFPDDVHAMLQSRNNVVFLKFDLDQDVVVVKRCDNTVLWKLVVVGLGTTVDMELNGNFVVYGYDGPAKYVAWESKTGGNPGADLRLQDDGHLCVYKEERGCIWSNEKRFDTDCDEADADPADGKTILGSGQILWYTKDHIPIWSQNGSVGIRILKEDGGVQIPIIFRKCDNETLWSPELLRSFRTNDTVRLLMQRDGNLVLYGNDVNSPYWGSGHHRHFAGAVAKLFDDGLLCVSKNGTCLWSTGKRFVNVGCSAESIMANSTEDVKTVLQSGQKFRFGSEEILSGNGSVGLRILKNKDGLEILSVFRKCDGKELWTPTLWRSFGSSDVLDLLMHKDGNLVIYGSEIDETNHQNMYWASGHYDHHSGAVLKLYDDGLLCVSKDSGCVWSSEKRFEQAECSSGPRFAAQNVSVFIHSFALFFMGILWY